MDRNLIHLQEFECIKKILTKLKVEYDEVCIGDNNNDPLEKEIIEKEEIKKKLMEKNKILKKNFFYYNEIIIKRNTQIELNSQKIKKKKLKYLDIEIDLDSIHREKYKQKIKTLKYKGLLLFDKIIQVIKNIINENYVKNDFYENFKKEKLKIIELDISFFDDENIQLIDTYIKKLVSIYEDVCKYVLYNHIQYKSKTAINGTLKPIDNKFGIPERIYDLTLDSFNIKTAEIFIKNMFKENCQKQKINRDYDNIKSELRALKNYKSNLDFKYDRIIISTKDMIIPTKNQSAFWGISPNTDAGHAPFNNFNKWSELL